jgi:hypothetical protein
MLDQLVGILYKCPLLNCVCVFFFVVFELSAALLTGYDGALNFSHALYSRE